jgi:nitroreductase/NAD-dependent dihydropyrimidine dehydrogenase PreA subunit
MRYDGASNAEGDAMGSFTVDESKCRRDGICAAVCPVGIITHSAGFLPQHAPGAGALCIRCGHCVAACPHGACAVAGIGPEECAPVRPEWRLSPEQAEHFLRSRRSIRAFKEKEVEQGRLGRLIGVARYAPSGHNRQPVRWLVISGREPVLAVAAHVVAWMRRILEAKPEMARGMLLDRVVGSWDAGLDPVCRSAPHLVVAHAAKDDATAPSACTLALGYLELAAPAFDLGACWAGYVMMASVHWPPLQEALALPEGQQLCGAMLVGEPRYRYARLPPRPEPPITWR